MNTELLNGNNPTTNNLRIVSWNPFTEQIPQLWTSDREGIQYWKPNSIIRVKGFRHSMNNLQWIYQIARENIEHKFLVCSDKFSDFEDFILPDNVVPILQLDTRYSIREPICYFDELCTHKDIELSAISLYCNSETVIPKYVKWAFLSGPNFKNIRNIIHNSSNSTAIYVEKYNYKNDLPTAINIRQFPKQLIEDMRPLLEYNTYQEDSIVANVAI